MGYKKNRFFDFLLTIAFLGGIGYAGYTYYPQITDFFTPIEVKPFKSYEGKFSLQLPYLQDETNVYNIKRQTLHGNADIYGVEIKDKTEIYIFGYLEYYQEFESNEDYLNDIADSLASNADIERVEQKSKIKLNGIDGIEIIGKSYHTVSTLSKKIRVYISEGKLYFIYTSNSSGYDSVYGNDFLNSFNITYQTQETSNLFTINKDISDNEEENTISVQLGAMVKQLEGHY